MSIIGKTNGANSSEHRLARASIGVIVGLCAAAVAAGLISPEHAAQIADLAETSAGLIAGVAAAYAFGRSIIKSVVAWQAGQFEEEDQ